MLYFEGDLGHLYRIIRARKNRFGATDEVAVFGMGDTGLREIQNPSEFFLSERLENRSGCCVAACVQGNKPILVEVQSLVTPSQYGASRRIVGEIDQQKLLLVAAVMSKYMVQGLDRSDIFVKVAGGVKISEPGIDLACGIAMVSSTRYPGTPRPSLFWGDRAFGRSEDGSQDGRQGKRSFTPRVQQGACTTRICSR